MTRALALVTAWARTPDDVITPWLEALVQQLREVDVELEVLAPAWRGAEGGTLRGVRVHRFRYAPAPLEVLSHEASVPDQLRARPWWSALVPGYLAAAALETTRLVQRERFELVHAFWPLPHALPGLVAARLRGVPLVSSFFGVELSVAARVPSLRAPLRALVRASDAVTAVSNFTAARLRALAPEVPVRVIPFGVSVSPGAPQPAAGAPSTSLRLLFIGRLVERKGLAVLLDALAQCPGVSLEVLGDGPLRGALERRAARLGERVTFRGFVSAEEKARALAACDALVLPAVVDSLGDTEGQGVVLLEAMAVGKPVVASAAGGIVDLVRDEVEGLLVPPGDVAALATAVRRLGTDQGLCARLGAAGRTRVETDFSWSKLRDDVADVYRRALAARAR